MPRPGFVLDVDQSTPPILFPRGDQLTREALPKGSRVVYAPEPLAVGLDPRQSIRNAIDNPDESDPLRQRLRNAGNLAIVFDDVATAPPQSGPDARQLAIEEILELAAAAEIDDVTLVAARGLNRRMTEPELRRILGDRIYESFAPNGLLVQHDAEDRDALTQSGEIALDSHVVGKDLVVYVHSHVPGRNPVGAALLAGIGDFDAAASVISGRRSNEEAITSVVAALTNLFVIGVQTNVESYAPPFDFMGKREPEWSSRDVVMCGASERLASALPRRLTQLASGRTRAPRSIAKLVAGNIASVDKLLAEGVAAHATTAVDGQSDVVTFGIPLVGQYNVNSIMNPVAAAVTALDAIHGSNTGTPVARTGGALLVHHNMQPAFHTVHHPSFIDFFEDTLSKLDDPKALPDETLDRFRNDNWYVHLYRTSNAFHGALPVLLWERSMRAMESLGGVIVIGGDVETVRRLGFKPASTFQDGLEMARDISGTRNPSLTHLHTPPQFVVDVRA